MSKIGLYVYQLKLSRKGSYRNVPFAEDGEGSELQTFLPQFIRSRILTNQNDRIERSWRLEPAEDQGRTRHGAVHYGTYGFSSKIVSPQNRDILYDRNSSDVEEIPLYYRFWIPDFGNFGFAALQSFRERSCVGQVLGDLSKEFNDRFDHLRLTVKKVMPTSDDSYRSSPVKKLILSKKKVPKDRAEIMRKLPPEELNVELSFSVGRSGRFGMYSDVARQIRAASGGAAFVFDGIEFDEASAIINIGNTYRKVGIVGPANSAGVIDITEDVELNEDQHPTFDSVSKVAQKIITDFRQEYGMR